MEDEKIVMMVYGAGICLIAGLIMGLFVAEMNADVIRHDALDEVCIDLYGEGTHYEEIGTGKSNEFVCKRDIVEVEEAKRVRLE